MPAQETFSTGSFDIGRATATADTVINAFVPPLGPRSKVRITDLLYFPGGTTHAITFFRELGRAFVYADVAAAATSIILDRDPGAYSVHVARGQRALNAAVADNPIAANDYIAYKAANGLWTVALVSAVAAVAESDRVTITVPAVATGGIQKYAPVVFFGITTDTSPLTGRAHDSIAAASMTASQLNTYGGAAGPVAQAELVDSPMLIQSNNATTAGTLIGGTAVGAM